MSWCRGAVFGIMTDVKAIQVQAPEAVVTTQRRALLTIRDLKGNIVHLLRRDGKASPIYQRVLNDRMRRAEGALQAS